VFAAVFGHRLGAVFGNVGDCVEGVQGWPGVFEGGRLTKRTIEAAESVVVLTLTPPELDHERTFEGTRIKTS
jgi:hypothetical protein